MTYRVDKGMPISPCGGRPPRYPYREMEVGDSFLIPNSDLVPSATQSAHTHARRVGIKVTVRTVADGVRVWRIA